MVLFIDNYDSFVHNLARYFRRLGHDTVVVRNDAVDVSAVRALRPEAILLSPGPCTPNEAGCSLDVVRELHRDVPILGVCLGHQVIAQAFGGRIIRAPEPMHGRASSILHSGDGLFAGTPSPMQVGRYHSLVADEASLPECLKVTARTTDSGVVMAVAHRDVPLFGVQFHPESILTEYGYPVLANFLSRAGLGSQAAIPELASERNALLIEYSPPTHPVTF